MMMAICHLEPGKAILLLIVIIQNQPQIPIRQSLLILKKKKLSQVFKLDHGVMVVKFILNMLRFISMINYASHYQMNILFQMIGIIMNAKILCQEVPSQ